jgi:hypothetical protein
LYLQVPLLRLGVLLEHAIQKVFARQLNDGHTHLDTKESLNHLSKEFGLQTLADWWFGTDIVDLYRQLISEYGYISPERDSELLKN